MWQLNRRWVVRPLSTALATHPNAMDEPLFSGQYQTYILLNFAFELFRSPTCVATVQAKVSRRRLSTVDCVLYRGIVGRRPPVKSCSAANFLTSYMIVLAPTGDQIRYRL